MHVLTILNVHISIGIVWYIQYRVEQFLKGYKPYLIVPIKHFVEKTNIKYFFSNFSR